MIYKGSTRAFTIAESLISCNLWNQFEKCSLTQNMRIVALDSTDAQFKKWLLQVGDESANLKNDGFNEYVRLFDGLTNDANDEQVVFVTNCYLHFFNINFFS